MKCDGSVKLVLPPHRIYVRYDTGIKWYPLYTSTCNQVNRWFYPQKCRVGQRLPKKPGAHFLWVFLIQNGHILCKISHCESSITGTAIKKAFLKKVDCILSVTFDMVSYCMKYVLWSRCEIRALQSIPSILAWAILPSHPDTSYSNDESA